MKKYGTRKKKYENIWKTETKYDEFLSYGGKLFVFVLFLCSCVVSVYSTSCPNIYYFVAAI